MLVLISPEKNVDHELELLPLFFEHGLEIYHLRKPDFTLEEQAKYLQEIPMQFHSKIVVHQHIEHLRIFDLKGQHVKSNQSLQTPCATKHVSKSFHQINDFHKEKDKINYGFISPVFPSISKNNYENNTLFDEIQNYVDHSKLVCLGGIDLDRTHDLKKIGVKNIAVLGAIWESEKPLDAFDRLMERWHYT